MTVEGYSLILKNSSVHVDEAYLVLTCISFPPGSNIASQGNLSSQQSLVCIQSSHKHRLGQQTFHWDYDTLQSAVHCIIIQINNTVEPG